MANEDDGLGVKRECGAPVAALEEEARQAGREARADGRQQGHVRYQDLHMARVPPVSVGLRAAASSQ